MENKNIFVIDMVFIVGTLLILVAIVGYSTPLVISPIDNYSTISSGVLFSIKNADTLLIDDNIEFASPDEYDLVDRMEVSLEPGVYYWKAVGVLQSEIRNLTVQTTVILELRRGEDGYVVINAGNTALNVDVFNRTQLVDQLELLPQEEVGAGNNKFVGAMK